MRFRFAGSTAPLDFTSLRNSAIGHWFEDNTSHASYLCTLQNAEEPVTVGSFAHLGALIDPTRVATSVMAELSARNKNTKSSSTQKEWKIACKNKQSKEIECKQSGWSPTLPNVMIHLEADKPQAKEVTTYLTRRFNTRRPNDPPRQAYTTTFVGFQTRISQNQAHHKDTNEQACSKNM